MMHEQDFRWELSNEIVKLWFTESMTQMEHNELNLSDYDRGLFQNLQAAYELVGDDLTLTSRQLNRIKSVGAELYLGRYNG